MYAGKNAGVLVCFNAKPRDSLLEAKRSLADIKVHGASRLVSPFLPLILVGCMAEMSCEDCREASLHGAETVASERGMIYVETSSKTGFNTESHFFICPLEVARKND
mmetsp:Transcript_1333/g.2830  ORF Transcript_1333/g.2830 Transcript_1333/m.2830 type:complete len:107 (+) Transcript_1333:780-1100(+)